MMNQPNNTENQETLIICNLTYFRSWHLREKVLWEVSVVIQRGFSGKFQKLYKADDPGSLLCFTSPQILWLPFLSA